MVQLVAREFLPEQPIGSPVPDDVWKDKAWSPALRKKSREGQGTLAGANVLPVAQAGGLAAVAYRIRMDSRSPAQRVCRPTCRAGRSLLRKGCKTIPRELGNNDIVIHSIYSYPFPRT